MQELRAVLSAMGWRARREETSKTMSLTSRLLSGFTEEHGAGTSGCAVRHGMARTARRNKQDNAAGVSFALKFHRGARCRNSGLCCPPCNGAHGEKKQARQCRCRLVCSQDVIDGCGDGRCHVVFDARCGAGCDSDCNADSGSKHKFDRFRHVAVDAVCNGCCCVFSNAFCLAGRTSSSAHSVTGSSRRFLLRVLLRCQ